MNFRKISWLFVKKSRLSAKNHDASWCIMMHHDLSWNSTNYRDFRWTSGNPPKNPTKIGERLFSQNWSGSFRECPRASKTSKNARKTWFRTGKKLNLSGPEIHPRWSSVFKLDEIPLHASFREEVTFHENVSFCEKCFRHEKILIYS